MTLRRLAIAAGALFLGWLVALRVLDTVFEGRTADRTTTRLAESLQGTATLGATDLALIRGRLDLQHLAVHRDDAVGHLAIDVDDVRCELAPLGWAIVDSQCDELAVRGVRLEVSSTMLFKLHPPKNKPLRADHVVLDDAVLAFSPSAIVPDLGRIEIRIEHAEAGPTTFRTPLSWLLSMEQLRARFELPAGVVLTLAYRDHQLSAAGTLFGSTPVTIPVMLPAGAKDGPDEMAQLVQLGKDVAEKLVARRAQDWLEQKLR